MHVAQELSTMIRVGTNPVIFLLDNAEYVIEEQIHPGVYNKLQDWDYCALAHAMKGKSDNLLAVKVALLTFLRHLLLCIILSTASSPTACISVHQRQLMVVQGFK